MAKPGIAELRIKKSKCFAKIKSEKSLSRLTHWQNRKKLKHEVDITVLPILIQNIGLRDSETIKLVLRFDNPYVQIIDFKSETFKIEHFFNSKPESIINEDLKSQNTDNEIVKYYNSIGFSAA